MKRRKRKEKKSSFVNENSDFQVYKRGALVGGLLGGIGGLILGKRIVLSIIIGAVAGGWINYQINNEESSSLNFKRYKQTKNNEDANDFTDTE